MKQTLIVIMIFALAAPSFAAIGVKGGLAGGTFRAAGMIDRQVRDNLILIADLGFGAGNSYTLASLGISGKMTVRNNVYAGIGVNYSAYTDTVNLPIGGLISEKSGIGLGLFVGLDVRDGLFIQAGYDTRLGGIAEAGYQIRK